MKTLRENEGFFYVQVGIRFPVRVTKSNCGWGKIYGWSQLDLQTLLSWSWSKKVLKKFNIF